MNNLNEYDEVKFKSEFENSELHQLISTDFEIIFWDKSLTNLYSLTPRQLRGERIFTMVPLYYLNKLLEANPTKIYDICCGWNIFKKYIPNIIGIDVRKEYVDIQATINEDYITSHKEYFESAFSICSLHLYSLIHLEKNIKDFVSMIKRNGRGFLSLNLQRMIERTSTEESINLFGTSNPSDSQYDQYIRSVVEKIPCEYLIVDIDINEYRDDYLNGNIRLVFEKR